MFKIFNKINPNYTYISLIPHRDLEEDYDSLFSSVFDVNPNPKNKISFSFKKGFSINPKYSYGHVKLIFKERIEERIEERVYYIYVVPTHLAEYIKKYMASCFSGAEIRELNANEVEKINCMLDNAAFKKSIGVRYEEVLAVKTRDDKGAPLQLGNEFYENKLNLSEGGYFAIAINVKSTSAYSWMNYCNSYKKRKYMYSKVKLTRSNFTEKCTFNNTIAKLTGLAKPIFTYAVNPFNKNNDEKATSEINDKYNMLSAETREKPNKKVYRSNISCYINDPKEDILKNRVKTALSNSIGDNYFDFGNDKGLVIKRKKNIGVMNWNSSCCELAKDEVSYFLRNPDTRVAMKYSLPYVKVNEVDLDTPSFTECIGKEYLGLNKYINCEYHVFLPEDIDTRGLPVVIVGPQGSGKSSLILEILTSHIFMKRGICNIDFENGCKTNKDFEKICKILGWKNYVVLNLTPKDLKSISFTYSETSELKETSVNHRCDALREEVQCQLAVLETYLGKELEPEEEELFISVSILTKIIDDGASLSTIFSNLLNLKDRVKLYSKFSDSEYSRYTNNSHGIRDELAELEKTFIYDNEKITGEKAFPCRNLKALRNTFKNGHLKELYYNSGENNINFREYMKENKILLINLLASETEDFTVRERDVLTTYFYTKAFNASSSFLDKSMSIPFSLVLDEIYRLERVQLMLVDKLQRCRKRQLRFYFTFHSASDLKASKIADVLLKNSKPMFRLLKDSDEEMYNLVPKDLRGKFSYLDIEEMNYMCTEDTRYCFNYVLTDKGMKAHYFITKLPPDLSKVADVRSLLDDIYPNFKYKEDSPMITALKGTVSKIKENIFTDSKLTEEVAVDKKE